MSTDECFAELLKFGRARVSCMNDLTWLCTIDVFVTGQGCEFSVKSAYTCPTPNAALNECVYLLRKALLQIKNMG